MRLLLSASIQLYFIYLEHIRALSGIQGLERPLEV